jgi:hypothetical protein
MVMIELPFAQSIKLAIKVDQVDANSETFYISSEIEPLE